VTRRPGKKRKGRAGKKYGSKNGVPTGVSMVGDNRYTAGSGTDEPSKIVVEALKPGEGTLKGRTSWDQLFPE